jgi:hypothetical protein
MKEHRSPLRCDEWVFGWTCRTHSGSNCSTRNLPAAAVDQSYADMDVTNRQARHRAFTFTRAILTDIEAANQAGIKPTLISVGLDGWACDERMILPWLRGSNVEFDLVLRLNGLFFGMSEEFVELHDDVYWATYDSNVLCQALEHGPGFDDKYDELIACWKKVQSGKDTSYGVNVGRNSVGLTATR